MKIYLDDLRTAPITWHLVKTADECIEKLQTGQVEELSLDHDLSEEHYLEHFGYQLPSNTKPAKTGLSVVDWMVENNIWPSLIILHTMNPIGRENMKRTIERYAPSTTKLEIRIGWKGP